MDYGSRTLEEVSSKDWSNQRMRLGVCSHSDRVAMGRSGGSIPDRRKNQVKGLKEEGVREERERVRGAGF